MHFHCHVSFSGGNKNWWRQASLFLEKTMKAPVFASSKGMLPTRTMASVWKVEKHDSAWQFCTFLEWLAGHPFEGCLWPRNRGWENLTLNHLAQFVIFWTRFGQIFVWPSFLRIDSGVHFLLRFWIVSNNAIRCNIPCSTGKSTFPLKGTTNAGSKKLVWSYCPQDTL